MAQIDSAMAAYPRLRAIEVLLTQEDISNLARQLHSRFRSDLDKGAILPHLLTLIVDIKTGAVNGHPLASVHILSALKEMQEFAVANEFWKWLRDQNSRVTDARVYGAMIETLAYQGEALPLLEELFQEATDRYSNASRVATGSAKETSATRIMLLQGIITARLLNGEWRSAYEAFDLILRLYPSATPPRVYELFIYERPVREAFIVHLMACRAGSPPKPQVLTPLLIEIWKETGDVAAIIRAVWAYVGAGGLARVEHLNYIVKTIFLSYPPNPENDTQEALAKHEEGIREMLGLVRDCIRAFRHLGINLAASTFNTLIICGGKLKRGDLVIGGLRDMIQSKVQPTDVTYRSLVLAAAELNDPLQFEAAWRLLVDAREDDKIQAVAMHQRMGQAQPVITPQYLPWDSKDWQALIDASWRLGKEGFAREQIEALKEKMSPLMYQAAWDFFARVQGATLEKRRKASDPLKIAGNTSPSQETTGTSGNAESVPPSPPNSTVAPGRPHGQGPRVPPIYLPNVVSELQRLIEAINSKVISSFSPSSPNHVPIDLDLTKPPFPPLPNTGLEEIYNSLLATSLEYIPAGQSRRFEEPPPSADSVPFTSTGFTVRELRFQNWVAMNKLIFEAELHERRIQEMVRKDMLRGDGGRVMVTEKKSALRYCFWKEDQIKERIRLAREAELRSKTAKPVYEEVDVNVRGGIITKRELSEEDSKQVEVKVERETKKKHELWQIRRILGGNGVDFEREPEPGKLVIRPEMFSTQESLVEITKRGTEEDNEEKEPISQQPIVSPVSSIPLLFKVPGHVDHRLKKFTPNLDKSKAAASIPTPHEASTAPEVYSTPAEQPHMAQERVEKVAAPSTPEKPHVFEKLQKATAPSTPEKPHVVWTARAVEELTEKASAPSIPEKPRVVWTARAVEELTEKASAPSTPEKPRVVWATRAVEEKLQKATAPSTPEKPHVVWMARAVEELTEKASAPSTPEKPRVVWTTRKVEEQTKKATAWETRKVDFDTKKTEPRSIVWPTRKVDEEVKKDDKTKATAGKGIVKHVPATTGKQTAEPVPATTGRKFGEPVPVTTGKKTTEPVPATTERKFVEPVPVTTGNKITEPVLATTEKNTAKPAPATTGKKTTKLALATTGKKTVGPVPATDRKETAEPVPATTGKKTAEPVPATTGKKITLATTGEKTAKPVPATTGKETTKPALATTGKKTAGPVPATRAPAPAAPETLLSPSVALPPAVTLSEKEVGIEAKEAEVKAKDEKRAKGYTVWETTKVEDNTVASLTYKATSTSITPITVPATILSTPIKPPQQPTKDKVEIMVKEKDSKRKAISDPRKVEAVKVEDWKAAPLTSKLRPTSAVTRTHPAPASTLPLESSALQAGDSVVEKIEVKEDRVAEKKEVGPKEENARRVAVLVPSREVNATSIPPSEVTSRITEGSSAVSPKKTGTNLAAQATASTTEKTVLKEKKKQTKRTKNANASGEFQKIEKTSSEPMSSLSSPSPSSAAKSSMNIPTPITPIITSPTSPAPTPSPDTPALSTSSSSSPSSLSILLAPPTPPLQSLPPYITPIESSSQNITTPPGLPPTKKEIETALSELTALNEVENELAGLMEELLSLNMKVKGVTEEMEINRPAVVDGLTENVIGEERVDKEVSITGARVKVLVAVDGAEVKGRMKDGGEQIENGAPSPSQSIPSTPSPRTPSALQEVANPYEAAVPLAIENAPESAITNNTSPVSGIPSTPSITTITPPQEPPIVTSTATPELGLPGNPSSESPLTLLVPSPSLAPSLEGESQNQESTPPKRKRGRPKKAQSDDKGKEKESDNGEREEEDSPSDSDDDSSKKKKKSKKAAGMTKKKASSSSTKEGGEKATEGGKVGKVEKLTKSRKNGRKKKADEEE